MHRTELAGLPELVARCAEGDRDALTEMFVRQRTTVFGVARVLRLGPEDVEDLAQTTFGAFADYAHRIRNPDAVPAWFARTARHEGLRILRRQGREIPTDAVPERPYRDDDPVDDELAHRARSLQEAIDSLPARDRELVIFLLTRPDASYREISEAIGMPIGSIGPIRGRAFGHLRELLGAEGINGALLDS
jgi:RNA polymerase sigma factor (sigma-70 family)